MTTPRWHVRVLGPAIVCGIVFVLGFMYGAVVGFYQIRPVGLLWKFDRMIRDITVPAVGEARYLAWAFRDPLPDGPLLNPPVRSLESLARQLEEFATVTNDAFFTAYQGIALGPLNLLDGDLVELEYSVGERVAKAYAYRRKSRIPSHCGVLVIPGSGHNMSSATLAANAFGIPELCDTYVLIKPNADYRAIHDGSRKLRREMFVVGLLRRGFSYSVTYLVEALAFQKYIRSQYTSNGVAGLSQGGEAALLVSLQSKPDFAIIASGFSVLQWQVTMAEFDQIIIPGIYDVYTLEHLRKALSSSRTRYLFTFGEREDLFYGVDARTRKSCQFLDSLRSPEVMCVIHGGAHEMPREVVLPFIERHKIIGANAPSPNHRAGTP